MNMCVGSGAVLSQASVRVVKLFSILVDLQQRILFFLPDCSLTVERQFVVFANVAKNEDVIGGKGFAKHCS